MTPEQQTVSALKKITLAIEAGTAEDQTDLTPEPLELEFIYGLGTGGLSALEIQLADLRVGEAVRLRLSPADWLRRWMKRLFDGGLKS